MEFSQAKFMQMRAALQMVAAVIDMTDPEHEDYADSCADAVQALCEAEPAIRRALA